MCPYDRIAIRNAILIPKGLSRFPKVDAHKFRKHGLAAPLSVTVALFPPAAGLIVPEMSYICGGGGWVDEFPLTTPEQPQDKAIEVSIPVSKNAGRTRKLSLRG